MAQTNLKIKDRSPNLSLGFTTGKIYIICRTKNTIFQLCNEKLQPKFKESVGFYSKNSKKHTLFACITAARGFGEKIQQMGLKEAHVVLKGINLFREGSVRNIAMFIKVLSLEDRTSLEHGGCRKPGPRKY